MRDMPRFSSCFFHPDRILHSVILLSTTLCLSALAQETSTYQQQGKLIRAPRDVARLGADLFGDKVNLYTGALEFVHNDISLPGNNALPVSVGRRLVVGQEGNDNALFGKWDIEIPHLHGVFAMQGGWAAGLGTVPGNRCSAFGEPPTKSGSYGSNSTWRGTEYWHGSFLYVPGAGDQEILRRNPSYTQAPGGDTAGYPLVTRNNWAFRCLPALAAGNTQSGEGFIAISPDGTQYRFDWMITRGLPILTKSNAGPAAARAARDEAASAGSAAARVEREEAGSADSARIGDIGESPNAIAGNALARVEVWILPTLVTDRFGNTVTYTYDPANQRRLTSINGSDASGSPRVITLNYGAAGTPMANLVTSVSDGTHTWQYAYDSNQDSANLSTVTLPDGSAWRDLNTLFDLQRDIEYLGEGGCESPGYANPISLTAHLIHPSGARGDFTLTQQSHGRAGVSYRCDYDPMATTYTPYYPKIFDTFSLTNKTITGPGIGAMQWQTTYSAEASSWEPCNGCNASKQVSVTDPAGAVTRHTFGTLFRQTEGQLQQTEVLDAGGNDSSAIQRACSAARRERPAPWRWRDGGPSHRSELAPDQSARHQL